MAIWLLHRQSAYRPWVGPSQVGHRAMDRPSGSAYRAISDRVVGLSGIWSLGDRVIGDLESGPRGWVARHRAIARRRPGPLTRRRARRGRPVRGWPAVGGPTGSAAMASVRTRSGGSAAVRASLRECEPAGFAARRRATGRTARGRSDAFERRLRGGRRRQVSREQGSSEPRRQVLHDFGTYSSWNRLIASRSVMPARKSRAAAGRPSVSIVV